jgi:hypothetical protein
MPSNQILHQSYESREIRLQYKEDLQTSTIAIQISTIAMQISTTIEMQRKTAHEYNANRYDYDQINSNAKLNCRLRLQRNEIEKQRCAITM